MGDPTTVLNLVARALVSLGRTTDPEASAEQVVAAVQVCVPGGSAALVLANDLPEVVAASDEAAARAEQWQIDLGVGPTVDALSSSTVVGPSRVVATRWPAWSGRVLALGHPSIVTSFPLGFGDQRAGALTLYTEQRPSDDEVSAVELVAATGSIALGFALDVGSITAAIDSRSVIGQAQGILMERFEIDADRAFAVLRRVSQTTNVKLRAVAEELVRTRATPGSEEGTTVS